MNNRIRASVQARESVESSFKIYEQNRRSIDQSKLEKKAQIIMEIDKKFKTCNK